MTVNKVRKSFQCFMIVMIIFCMFSGMRLSAESKADDVVLHAWEVFSYSDAEWSDYTVQNTEALYDKNGTIIGSLLELTDSEDDAYAIVLNNNGSAIVVETGKGISSPYAGYENKMKVFTSPLNYYVMDSKESSVLLDLTNKETITKESLSSTLFPTISSGSDQRVENTRSTVTYLYNYSTYFENCVQPNGYACVPTSHAMALKYLHNRGKITISSTYTNVSTMATKLYDMMKSSDGHCYTPTIQNQFASFCSSYTNKTITSTVTWNSGMTFSAAKSEIDVMYPLVLMFVGGTPNMYSSNHATTMVGYKIVTGTTTMNYAIVVDPGTSPGVQKTMAWDSTYLYGYFILTVY